jgi:hypothetical protein
MAGSKRTFEYVLKPTGEDVEQTFRRAQRILGWACEGDKRIECHGISGEGLGVVKLNLTVTGRDQWACRQLVQDILNLVVWGLEKDATRLDLQSRRQEPHLTRGYGAGGRTKTYRSPKSSTT